MFSWYPNHLNTHGTISPKPNMLLHCQSQSLPGPVPGGKQRKTLGWWWSYQKPIPKHSLTLLPSPEPLILLPGPVPGRKQRKTMGWWWPDQELIPLPVTSTLSHFSRASHPAARSNTLEKTKENTVLVVVLARTYSPASDKHSLTLLPTGNTELLLLLPRTTANKKALCFIGSLAPWLKPCDISNVPMLPPPTTLKSLLPTAGQPSGTLQSSASAPLTWASSLGKVKHFFCPLQHSRLAVLHPVAPANIGQCHTVIIARPLCRPALLRSKCAAPCPWP